MPLTADQLLLTADRKSQLEAALANEAVQDPLGDCITWAETEVARLTQGYVIAAVSLDGWAQSLALWRAFTLAALGVPEDIAAAYKAAMDELTAIAKGERPNLVRTADESSPAPSTGNWGSREKII